jgi:hypothetical protein
MVTARHEAMHRIFQEDPGVFARAFKALGIPFPTPIAASVLSPDATERKPIERRIDSVIRFETDDSGPYLLAVEAQCQGDKHKPAAWAYHASYLSAKHEGIPVIVLAVCQDLPTARWAQGPFEFGLPLWPTLTVRPVVAGPHNVPLIADPAKAAQDIPLATLSAITHARDAEVESVLRPLAAALKTVDEETRQVCAELTELGLGEARAAKLWSKIMAMDLSFYRSRTSQKLRAEGFSEANLLELEERGIPVSDEVRERIESCDDRRLLRAWIRRAMTVESADQIFYGNID